MAILEFEPNAGQVHNSRSNARMLLNPAGSKTFLGEPTMAKTTKFGFKAAGPQVAGIAGP